MASEVEGSRNGNGHLSEGCCRSLSQSSAWDALESDNGVYRQVGCATGTATAELGGGGGDGLDEALAEREESRMTSRYLLLFW